MKKVNKMNTQQIIDFYDSNPNLLLSELARITGKSVKELKAILMGAIK